MPDASLLTDDVRAQVGREGPPALVTVSRRAVERTMDLYRGNHHGRLAEGDPVPGYVLVALQPEAESVAIPELMPNSLLISNELTVERPLRLGEQVTVQSRLADISERLGGRFGYSLYVRTETNCHDASGAFVARMSQTLMYYDPAAERAGDEP